MQDENFIKEIKELMAEFYRFNFRISTYHRLLGVDFVRFFEYAWCVKKINLQKNDNILDVGSLKSFFPLFLASKGGNVTLLDLDERVLHQLRYYQRLRKNLLINSKFNVYVGDIRKTNFPDSSFDIITCISTVEHIPGNGDIETVREFQRLLKCGGKVFISFPYRQKYEEGKWGRWTQKYYNYHSIRSRLISPSGLKLKEIGFFIDHNAKKIIDLLICRVPRIVRFALQWTHYFFANYYVTRDNANKFDAGAGWILMEKL